MTITVSGVAGEAGRSSSAERSIEVLLKTAKVESLSVATAYLSIYGADFILRLRDRLQIDRVRMVAGLSQRITHPSALRTLWKNGINTRLAESETGIFHPKLGVGSTLSSSGRRQHPVCTYIGSANITRGGLRSNVEAIECTRDPRASQEAQLAFDSMWRVASPISARRLSRYEQGFARAIRERSLKDLRELGVIDDRQDPEATKRKRSRVSFIETRHCSVVWVGLESFTGEHTLQVEFPRTAGEALRSIIARRRRRVRMLCADGKVRTLIFDYYEANMMYRLNVPNDVPLVDWVRTSKKGYLKISTSPFDHWLHLDILKPNQVGDLVEKSDAVGTLGRTSTRDYGWY